MTPEQLFDRYVELTATGKEEARAQLKKPYTPYMELPQNNPPKPQALKNASKNPMMGGDRYQGGPF